MWGFIIIINCCIFIARVQFSGGDLNSGFEFKVWGDAQSSAPA